MTTATRWAGVRPSERGALRRELLVDAGYELFGTGGEAAVSVRAVCREAQLHTRYFYESFADTDELLGAVHDRVAGELSVILMDSVLPERGRSARLRAGIREVLAFSASDPRRGRVLFSEARANAVLAARRDAIARALLESVLAEEQAAGSSDTAARVQASLFTGAMVELAQAWLRGELGADLDAVVERAVGPSLALFAG